LIVPHQISEPGLLLHIRLVSLQVMLSAKLCIGMVVLVWKARLLV
jgi:hypothetical protein